MLQKEKPLKFAFFTLGCKLNFSETATFSRRLKQHGFQQVSFNDKADIYLINTCSVTARADRKSKQAIKKVIHRYPAARIVVTGCFAQLQPQAIARIPGVDLVIGTGFKSNVFQYIKDVLTTPKKGKAVIYRCDTDDINDFFPAFSSGNRTRSFLKIQDGCDYHCAYCTVPLARGHSRNNDIQKIVKQAEQIAKNGFKEIVLTGVNIGDFGKSTNESFFELLLAIENVKGIERIRISSVEPNLLTDEIIELVADSSLFLPHFHIPLQSGSNQLLALMKRRYKREVLVKRVEKIRQLMPMAFIGIDVIVGLPGETDQLFEETRRFLQQLDISFVHVFSYSQRPATEALKINPKVNSKIIHQRSAILHKLSAEKQQQFYKKNIGQHQQVLFEKQENGNTITGFTRNYIKVELPYNPALFNQIKNVQLTQITTSGNMQGEIID